MKNTPSALFWFRRDLRLEDNKALFQALTNNKHVIPLFIFDTDIIDHLPPNDARVEFIHEKLQNIDKALRIRNRKLLVVKGKPSEVLTKLVNEYAIQKVYAGRDHEPYGIKRDEIIQNLLKKQQIDFYTFIDHLLFDKEAVLKKDNSPYLVFTPYSKKSREIISKQHLEYYPSEKHIEKFLSPGETEFPSLRSLGFRTTGVDFPPSHGKESIITAYEKTRDYPAMDGTTRYGMHLRFGTISIRQLARHALKNNETYFNELLWREFYAMILGHYPQVVHKSFKPQYDNIEWRNDEDDFQRWKEGETGYPLVDAGMRELAQTGYMHNRVRMVTASFLTKHLLIDWRWGEAWFAEKLLDYELSSNNGGWQWSAGSGCDAAPYFRIFNPQAQQKKFDPQGMYIKKWAPRLNSLNYPKPIVDHKYARQRCLDAYKKALQF